jgi:hypothetical protein
MGCGVLLVINGVFVGWNKYGTRENKKGFHTLVKTLDITWWVIEESNLWPLPCQ